MREIGTAGDVRAGFQPWAPFGIPSQDNALSWCRVPPLALVARMTPAHRKVTMNKKPDSRIADNRITESVGNVFLDLGFDPTEAEVMKLRSELMIKMEQHVKAQGWTQTASNRSSGRR